MFPRTQFTLSRVLLLVLVVFILSLFWLLQSTSLLWLGVTTQGVITGVETDVCAGRPANREQKFSVQFTDRTGQTQIGTFSQCDYSGFSASPGDSVAIVYLPNDPNVIAPPDVLLADVQVDLIVTILSGLTMPILLALWIRRQNRKASLQDQFVQTKLTAEQIQLDRAELSAKRDQQDQTVFDTEHEDHLPYF